MPSPDLCTEEEVTRLVHGFHAFQRWLALFGQTTATRGNPAMTERANELALRVAQSLWYGYQAAHEADAQEAGT